MHIKIIAFAASLPLVAATSSRAEANKACISKATETLPRISGLVIKKTRTRPVPAAIFGDVARPNPTDHRGCGYRCRGRATNLFIHVCADERGGVRAPRNELATLARQQEKPPSGGLILHTKTEVVNMEGNRYYGVRVEGAKYGVSFGSALAIAISYTANHSILWAIIHGILGWLYVIYYALFRS